MTDTGLATIGSLGSSTFKTECGRLTAYPMMQKHKSWCRFSRQPM